MKKITELDRSRGGITVRPNVASAHTASRSTRGDRPPDAMESPDDWGHRHRTIPSWRAWKTMENTWKTKWMTGGSPMLRNLHLSLQTLMFSMVPEKKKKKHGGWNLWGFQMIFVALNIGTLMVKQGKSNHQTCVYSIMFIYTWPKKMMVVNVSEIHDT